MSTEIRIEKTDGKSITIDRESIQKVMIVETLNKGEKPYNERLIAARYDICDYLRLKYHDIPLEELLKYLENTYSYLEHLQKIDVPLDIMLKVRERWERRRSQL